MVPTQHNVMIWLPDANHVLRWSIHAAACHAVVYRLKPCPAVGCRCNGVPCNILTMHQHRPTAYCSNVKSCSSLPINYHAMQRSFSFSIVDSPRVQAPQAVCPRYCSRTRRILRAWSTLAGTGRVRHRVGDATVRSMSGIRCNRDE